MYACANYEGVVPTSSERNTMTPTFMRAPGEATGMFVLECAMDETGLRSIGIDPLEMRLRNHRRRRPGQRQPLVQPRTEGVSSSAAQSDSAGPAATRRRGRDRDGDWLIGTGMAAAAYPVTRRSSSAAGAGPASTPTAASSCRSRRRSSAPVSATAMTQVAADALGGPRRPRAFEVGDTDLPNIAAAVGSAGAGMISAAVHRPRRRCATNCRSGHGRPPVAAARRRPRRGVVVRTAG